MLLQHLALLKGHDLGGMSPTDPDFLHLWVETAKLAFADREAFYGDPDFSDVPMAEMLSEPYNAARAKLIDMGRASMEQRRGAPGGRAGAVQARLASGGPAAAGVGEPTVRRDPASGRNDAHGESVRRSVAGVGEPTVRRDGFTIVEDAIEPGLIDALNAALLRLERGANQFVAGGFSHAMRSAMRVGGPTASSPIAIAATSSCLTLAAASGLANTHTSG